MQNKQATQRVIDVHNVYDLYMFCFAIKCPYLNLISFLSSLILIFSIIQNLDYPDYFI